MYALIFVALSFGSCVNECGAGAGIDVLGARVYECAAIDGTERWLELCWDGSALDLGEALTDEPGGLWTCTPTQRHAGPCRYRCPSERGANALNGSYCP